MAATQYVYDIGEATLNGVVNGSGLKQEIQGSSISVEVDYINTDSGEFYIGHDAGTLYIWFDDALTAEEQSTLDAVVAAHTGAKTLQVRFHGSSTILQGVALITEENWAVLGGVVTTPEFFGPVGSLKTRIIGSFKTDGEGAEIRLMEDGTKELGSFALSDTLNQWETMQWFSVEPGSSGTHEYTLEAKIGTAASASVKFVSMSLLEFYV